jgi:hypothetical protein
VVNTPTDSVDLHAWVKLVPKLKIRCVAAHFLQQALHSLREESLVPFLEEEPTTALPRAHHKEEGTNDDISSMVILVGPDFPVVRKLEEAVMAFCQRVEGLHCRWLLRGF